MTFDQVLVIVNTVFSLAGFFINIFAYRRSRELGRWVFLIMAFNCLVVLITYVQILVGDAPCVTQLRGEITLILASLIAAPLTLGLGRRKCP